MICEYHAEQVFPSHAIYGAFSSILEEHQAQLATAIAQSAWQMKPDRRS